MKKIFYLIICVSVIISCSDDKEANTTTAPILTKAKAASPDRMRGEIPRNKQIFDILSDADNYSIAELESLYKRDIATIEKDYAANLKNMWLTLLNPKLFSEGTEEQKLFFIKEQIALDNNLAHFTGFYNLLASSKLINGKEKEIIGNDFYEKNIEAIDKIEWKTPYQKKAKQNDLVWAKRNFSNLTANQK